MIRLQGTGKDSSFCIGENMKPILFGSQRPLERAENIKIVHDAYQGEKRFIQLNPFRFSYEISYSDYELMVTDEFPAETPGKAIMIGHGISASKTFGMDQPYRYISDHETRLLTAVTCASEQTVDLTAKQCGVDRSKVYPIGMPRTDYLVGKRKGDGGTELAKKRSYLYVPTFRGEFEPKMPLIDWQYIDDHLRDDELLAIKPHMITGDAMVRDLKHIIALSSDVPTNPYLIDCDVVITDYSSLIFDAHIAGKPLVLFAKDVRSYQMRRGMYYDYPNGYGSRYTDNERDLVRLLRYACGQNELDLLCKERCCSACDGHSTERVLQLIERIANG